MTEEKAANLKERMGTELKALSPAHHVSKKSPPCIIFHGVDDPTVLFVTAEVFTAEMKKAGARCELKGYEGQVHGFFNYGHNENKPFNQTLKQLDEFLVSLGWIEKK